MTESMGFQIMMLLYFILAGQTSDNWKPLWVIMGFIYFIFSMIASPLAQAFFKGLLGK